MPGLNDSLRQIVTFVRSLTIGKLLSLGISLAVITGGFFYVLQQAKIANYGVLFSGLEPQDAGQIITQLGGQKCPYLLADGGRTIKIPQNMIYETRIHLATMGLPEGGGVGFEIFDKSKLGITDFMQRVNYNRALQGELARTIGQLSAVESARVMLVVPERSLFVSEEHKPSASVVLRLKRGKGLSENQVEGISNLVACSVEGLESNRVTVINSKGDILAPRKRGEGLGASDTQMAFKKSFEHDIEQRMESMLERTVGKGHVVSRVSATFDFTQAQKTEESYDPDSVVVKEEETSELTYDDMGVTQGTVGTQSALPGGTAPETSSSPEIPNKQILSRKSYELSKTKTTTITPAGQLKNLTVAVLVDDIYETTTDEEGNKVTTSRLRTPEEILQLEEIVKVAVGYSEDREGDKVTVANVSFKPEPLDSTQDEYAQYKKQEMLQYYLKIAVIVVIALLLFLFFVRPFLKSLSTISQGGFSHGALPGAHTALPGSGGKGPQMNAMLEEYTRAHGESAGDNLTTIAQSNPEKAAQILRKWMGEKK